MGRSHAPEAKRYLHNHLKQSGLRNLVLLADGFMTAPLIHACDVAPDCRYVAIIGYTNFHTTMDNAQRLIDRIETGQYASVVIDYRQADPVLSPSQYAELFRLTGPAIKTLERFAYLYNERTVLFAAHASRSILELGVPARAFEDWAEAAAFLGVSGPDPALGA